MTRLRKTNRTEQKQRAQELLALDWSPSDLSALAEELVAMNTRTEDTIEDVATKSERFSDFQESFEFVRSKLEADAWCAAFVTPKRSGEPVITDDTVRAIREAVDVEEEVEERIREMAYEYRFIHPHLAFPDVFDEGAGFDVVLGSPPWERVKLQEKEWFATRDPDIATAPNKAGRRRLIVRLKHDNPALYDAFQAAARQAEGIRTVLRNSGRYPLCGRGDVNTYTESLPKSGVGNSVHR